MNATENEDRDCPSKLVTLFFLNNEGAVVFESPIKSDKAAFIVKNDNMMFDNDPLTSSLYTLKWSEAKRQYPARLMKFFDYLEDNTVVYPKNKNDVKIKLEQQARFFVRWF